jgi:hypothetical protein
MPKRKVTGLTRGAAVRLALNVALLLGATCLALALISTGTPPAKPDPFYAELPGADLAGLPPERKATMLKHLNRQRCTCGCGRSVASCRNNHGSCSLSLAAAREAVESARKQ